MKVLDFLDSTSTQYEVTDHRPTFTAQQMAAEEHIPGIKVAKPVIVEADQEYYMCVLPACCKIDLDSLRMQLGADEISLANETDMTKLFPDCALGAEPPFGAFYGLLTFMDQSLEKDDYIVFQAGSHERSIKLEMKEYLRLANPRIISFSYHCS